MPLYDPSLHMVLDVAKDARRHFVLSGLIPRQANSVRTVYFYPITELVLLHISNLFDLKNIECQCGDYIRSLPPLLQLDIFVVVHLKVSSAATCSAWRPGLTRSTMTKSVTNGSRTSAQTLPISTC